MVDANYAFDVERAIAAARALRPLDPLWFEEPIAPDDFGGYARIAAAVDLSLATGENLRTLSEFEQAVERARLSYLQPDASNCGGVTGWLAVARLCVAHGMPCRRAGACRLGRGPCVRDRPVHDNPLRPVDGRLVAPDAPGIGVEFDWERLRSHAAG